MTEPLPTPRFTGIFIPVEILEMQEITPLEQMLLSWIDALFCKEKGGCYATNEYLAKRLRVKENTIAKSISNLRRLGLIKDVSFNGRLRVIKACIREQIEKGQSNAELDLNPRQGWKKIQPWVGKKSKAPPRDLPRTDSKEESKEDNLKKERKIKERKSQDSANASPVLVAPEVFIFLEQNVRLTELEYTTLQKQHSPQLIQVAAKILSDWKLDNPSKTKKLKSDYRALLRWAITAAREAQIREEELRQREERVKKVDSQKKVEIKKDEKSFEIVKNKIKIIGGN